MNLRALFLGSGVFILSFAYFYVNLGFSRVTVVPHYGKVKSGVSTTYDQITIVGDSRVRSLYLLFVYVMQHSGKDKDISSIISDIIPDVNPKKCIRERRLEYGNNLVCDQEDASPGTWQGCVPGALEKPGCYYDCVNDTVILARDCTWRNRLDKRWSGCEERYIVIDNIRVEYIYTTSIFWSDPYLSGIVERAQLRKDPKHLYILQTNTFSYFNTNRYKDKQRISCAQFFREMVALLQRLEDIPKGNVLLLSNSFYPGFFEKNWSVKRERKLAKSSTHIHNYFNFSNTSKGIWHKLELISANQEDTGAYNFKFCAWGEIIARRSPFKWIDALSPTYEHYFTYDSKHFFPFVHKSQLNAILNWVYKDRKIL